MSHKSHSMAMHIEMNTFFHSVQLLLVDVYFSITVLYNTQEI